MPARPYTICRLFRWWQVPVALILSVTISLSQPVFTGCFRGEGFRLGGTRVFCRGSNRTERNLLEVDWGLEKRGARVGNEEPHAGLGQEDWLVDKRADEEMTEIEGEGEVLGEAGLTREGKGLSADRIAEPGQLLDLFEGGLVMPIEAPKENEEDNIARQEAIRLEEETELEDEHVTGDGEGKGQEEGEKIKGDATEEVWKEDDESSAERKEPSTEEKAEFQTDRVEAEGKDGGQNREEYVASESGSVGDLLLEAAEDESEELRGEGAVGPHANRELSAKGAEEDRPHPSCRPHELVYVYDLPPEFNVELFGPSCGALYLAYTQARNACVIYSPEFGGIGPRLTGTETAFLSDIGSPADSWADTGQFGLEVMFHQYMRDSYPCRTTRGEDAAAFYVPIYTGVLHLNRTTHCGIGTCPGVSPLGWVGRLLGAQLNKLPYLRRHKGRDHITTMGRCTYDGLQDDTCCTNGLLKTKHTKRFVIMGIESNDLTSQERQVSIPYPTCFHPATPEEITTHKSLILSANRTVLINFTGQLDRDALWWGRNLRSKIAEQCANHPGECEVVNCGSECYCTTVLSGQLRAQFCLQPPGDTPTRRSFFDSLQAGCIPVLFQRASAYDEYTSFLPADESSYSVFIPEGDVTWGGADIIETLQRIPEAEIERKRAVIASMLPSISYEDHGRARERARRAAAGPQESLPETQNPLGEKSAYGVALAEALRRVERALDAAAAEASS
ncbi:Exostosin family protein [Klebsormidium nitens]|uniref:Exostosin family protein n=1 Tax=Klebsormidium nitens TaxID=105231 RepID=A0A1Y1HU92_KLENI|nr:Exostosin family protein [Klebsormidium nitens]|eukprot:GAQ80107.1 Exostosin family protein [Klebsormidium nitens]